MRREAGAHALLVLCLPVLAAAWLAFPSLAFAQEAGVAADAAPADPITPDAITVATGDPVPARATPPAEPLWTLAASGGVSARDDGPDGSWQSLSLTRRLGRGYVRATAMRYHGTLLQADVALPSDYYVGTLGAGGNFDNWVVDGWASYGRQSYGRIRTTDADGTRTGSRRSTGAKGSDYYAIGGDFGRVMPLGGSFYLTPTVAASFANGRLLRPAPTGSGLTDLETGEPTWSANATLRVDHAFGPGGVHYAGLSFSRNWTSNGISALTLRRTPGEDGTARFDLDSKHYADGWFEAGAAASMKLGRDLYLDLFGTRSFGVEAGNVTSAGATLRKSF
jgi:hypothetical protein